MRAGPWDSGKESCGRRISTSPGREVGSTWHVQESTWLTGDRRTLAMGAMGKKAGARFQKAF